MKKKAKPATRTKLDKITLIRWTTRILSFYFILLMLMFLFGEGLNSFADDELRKIIMTLAFVIILSGMITAWFKEGIGAYLIFGGAVVFWTVNMVTTGIFFIHWIFLFFPLIGGLYLYLWRSSLGKRKR